MKASENKNTQQTMLAKQDSHTEQEALRISTPLDNKAKHSCLFVHTPLKWVYATCWHFTFVLIFLLYTYLYLLQKTVHIHLLICWHMLICWTNAIYMSTVYQPWF